MSAVAVVLATALYFDLKGHSVMTNVKIQNVQSCVYIVKLLVITKNVPVLLRGTFYRHSVSAMKLSSLNELRGLFYYFQLESLLHLEHIAESILFFSFFAI